MSDPRTVTLADIEAMDGPTYTQFKKDLSSNRVAIDASDESNPVEVSDGDRLAAGDWTEAEAQAALDAQATRISTRQSQAILAPFMDAAREDEVRYGKGSPSIVSVRDRVINAIANGQNDAERQPYKAALTYLREQEKAAKAE